MFEISLLLCWDPREWFVGHARLSTEDLSQNTDLVYTTTVHLIRFLFIGFELAFYRLKDTENEES